MLMNFYVFDNLFFGVNTWTGKCKLHANSLCFILTRHWWAQTCFRTRETRYIISQYYSCISGYRKNISISKRQFWEEQLFELYTHSFSQYLFSFSSILNKHLFVCELEGKLRKWNMVNFTRCVIYKVCALREVSRKT